MKMHIARIALFSLVAAALVAIPVASRADDSPTTDKPAAAAPAPKKNAHTAFHGSVTAVDTAAMTLTVDTNTIYVTSGTKITKDGKPAILSEIAVGEMVKGIYKLDDAGKLDATVIHAGEKASKKPKKKATVVPPAAPAAPAPPAN